jgi:hypothetical protein
MKSELAEEIFALIEAWSPARPTPMEFEMAYQARVAMDRIRFAIKHTEQFGPQTEPLREAGLQLLDALQRLETVDRGFQVRSRSRLGAESRKPIRLGEVLDLDDSRPLNKTNGCDQAQRGTQRQD